MSNTWAIISLACLVVVVIISNWKNINVGLVGFAMAMLLSTIAGLKLKDVYNSFNTQIFLRLLGMQTLIVIARTNGTLKILANAVMKLTKGKLIRLLPIILYFAMGMGGWFNLGINAVLTPLVFALGVEMGFSNHLTLGFCTMFNLFSWGISPYSMGGLNLAAYAAEQGYTLNLWAGAFTAALVGSIMFFAMYFFFGWHKMQPIELKSDAANEKITFGFNQIMTLIGFAAFVVMNLVFKVDMMVTPIIVAIVLLCLGCGNSKIIIKEIPWNSLIMIGGMTVYVGIIKLMGGVELLSAVIVAVANKTLAPAVMNLICAFMSIFASGNGVVIPTMSATISSLEAAIPGLPVAAMFWAVAIGANATPMSPMSTVGANSLAYYSAAASPDEAQFKKAFNRQLIVAVIAMVWSTVAALLGMFAMFQ
jgi:di/tricarboxylate transporter